MRRQLALVRATPAALERYFGEIRLDPTFGAFCDLAQRFADLIIVSDGIDRAIETALDKAGFGHLPFFSNALSYRDDVGLSLDFPFRRKECVIGNGVCKCEVARNRSVGSAPVVLIGDGRSDTCLAATADMVFAKGSLAAHCQEHRIPFEPFESFADITRVVERWDFCMALTA